MLVVCSNSILGMRHMIHRLPSPLLSPLAYTQPIHKSTTSSITESSNPNPLLPRTLVLPPQSQAAVVLAASSTGFRSHDMHPIATHERPDGSAIVEATQVQTPS